MINKMNCTLASFCLDAFEKALSSPIGNAIKFYYESLTFIPPDDINILLLNDRLMDRTYYDSPESFIVDLQNYINRACCFFGTQSDISIALLSFQYSVQNFLQPILELRENILKQGISKNDSKWEISKNTLLENLNNFIDKMPNDIESFKKFTDPIQYLPYVDNEEHEKYPNPEINIDVLDLKSRIERIDQDINLYELVGIIEKYQPELSGTIGNIKFDLNKLHPHTLFKINEYVKKCKLRPPPVSSGFERIQRSQSVPIKKSSSSSTIILQNPLHNKSFQQQQELQQQVQNQQQQIQNQIQAQVQPTFQNQFTSNNGFFTTNEIARNASLQNINQQQQLQMQLKNINSYNVKNNRNNVSFSHVSPVSNQNSIDLKDQLKSISPSSSSSLIGLGSPQSCLISSNPVNSSQMMSNITVQPSTMPNLSPQPIQSQQKPKQKRQPKQYKTQNSKKNQFANEISANSQNNLQLQLQMQMMQQQSHQNLNSDSHQFPPYLKEALSIARMNMMLNDLKINNSETQQQQQTLSSASFSAPQTPASIQNSSFISTNPTNVAQIDSNTNLQQQQQSFAQINSALESVQQNLQQSSLMPFSSSFEQQQNLISAQSAQSAVQQNELDKTEQNNVNNDSDVSQIKNLSNNS